jgi:thiosulfate dehydrogenase [quinone] large subunit
MALFEHAFERRELKDPTILRTVFGNTALAPLWLIARLYLGYQWLLAGWHKLYGDDRWVYVDGPDGVPLRKFWERAVAIPEEGNPIIRYDWYRDFLDYLLRHDAYQWFSWVIAVGEVAVGIALIVGVFTGFAALGGAFMNFNFLLAGSASTNPVLFILAVLVMFGWKVAGWIGIDRWLLPALGTPWQSGRVVRRSVQVRRAPTLATG